MTDEIRGSKYRWTIEGDAVVISQATLPVAVALVSMIGCTVIAATWTYQYCSHFVRPEYGPWPLPGLLFSLVAVVGFGAFAWEVAHWTLRVRVERRRLEKRSFAEHCVREAEGPFRFRIEARTMGGGHVRLRRVELMAEADGMEPVAVITLRDGMEDYLRPLERQLSALYGEASGG